LRSLFVHFIMKAQKGAVNEAVNEHWFKEAVR
jgi:hypothetical protein